MDYKELLENSLKQEQEDGETTSPTSRLVFLSEYIFDFTTYDSRMSKLFATKAIEVIEAVNNKDVATYRQRSEENYQWYLIMANMPFFKDRLDWGGSIRYPWWSYNGQKFSSCGLYVGEEQFTNLMEFEWEEWEKFMKAVVEFAKPEMNQ